jgi:hypothetical protein
MTNRNLLLIALLALFPAPLSAQAQVPTISPSVQRAAQIVHASQTISPAGQAALRAAAEDRQLTEVLVEIDDWLEWKLGRKTVYTHSGVHRIMREDFLATEEGAWKPTTRTQIQSQWYMDPYVTEIDSWNEALGDYEPDTRFAVKTYCFVFTTGTCAVNEQVEQKWLGDEWANIERVTYTHHHLDPVAFQHAVKSHTLEEWHEGAWVPVERYNFDDNTSTFAQSWITRQTWSGSAWVDAERTVFDMSLVQLQNRLNEIWSQFQDYGGLLLPLQLPDHSVYVIEDGFWDFATRQRTEYTFEGDRRVRTEFILEGYQNESWVPAGSITIDYDATGKPELFVVTGLSDEEEDDDEQFPLYERYSWSPEGYLVSGVQGILVFGNEVRFTRHTLTWSEAAVSIDQPQRLSAFRLDAAYPNPFYSGTVLPYHLDTDGPLSVRVFDVLGRQVTSLFDGYQSAGAHVLTLDASALASGVYFVQMEVEGRAQTQRVVRR